VSAPSAPRPKLGLRARAAALVWLASLPREAAAGPTEPPLLLGGPVAAPARTVTTDPRLPVGPAFDVSVRPPSLGALCSERLPVCVHATSGMNDAGRLSDALAAFETAFERVVYGLGLPAPLTDHGRGGSDALDLYLIEPDPFAPAFARVQVGTEAMTPGGFDRAPGFCTVMTDDPALLRRSSTLCVAEALVLRLDPGETPHARRAFATALWWIVGSPTNADFEAIAAVQAVPSRPLAARDLGPESEGSAILFSYLERKLGSGDPGALATALFAASAQTTAADAPTWQNEPDTFDVIRHTLDESEQRVASLLGDLAVSRAFLGSREDGLHLPELAWSGAFGAAAFDWVLPFASLPRRVRLTPLEPTGAVLVWVDLTGAPPSVPLGFQAEWEPPAEFQWVLVRVGADGRELGRIEVPFQERATSVEGRLIEMGDARAVLVAGAPIERVDSDHPFDPDVAPFEPHGAMVYVVEL